LHYERQGIIFNIALELTWHTSLSFGLLHYPLMNNSKNIRFSAKYDLYFRAQLIA